MSVLHTLTQHLWCPWLLGGFLLTGLVYSLGSGFFPFFHARLWLRTTLGSLFHSSKAKNGGGLSSIQALATALASTMGTGSISGVAAALCLGGPGAVFWMWVSALLGMMTSCGEKLLSVRYQRIAPGGGRQGGPMFYLRDGVGSPLLAVWFSLACLPATLAGGGMVQSGSIAASLHGAFGWPSLAIGLGTAAAAGMILTGGLGRIARVSQALVPAMALLYLGGGALVLLLRWQQVPQALSLIFRCALTPEAALGGGLGWTAVEALHHGVARGVFTNEAGLGTSAMAHGAAEVDHPARQGMWGIFEVFFATLLTCTLTALVILVGGVYQPGTVLSQLRQGMLPDWALGVPLTARSFSAVLGEAGAWIVWISLLLFAFSSILGWSYYGQQSLRFLTGGDHLLPLYRAVFLGCVVLGACGNSAGLWQLVDLCNALMAIPNLLALLLLAPQALRLLREWIGQQNAPV